MFPSSDQSLFPEDVQEDIEGLIWLGYLEDHFSFCGHDFVIRTLRGDEELLAGLVMKEYVETVGQAKAHVWAQIALALVAVDGADDFCPAATPDKRDYARARFQYVTSHWYWPVALYLFSRYNGLQKRQQDALDALEDFWVGSLPSHMPFVDSSTDKGSSAPIPEDIREYLDPDDDSTPSSSDSSPS